VEVAFVAVVFLLQAREKLLHQSASATLSCEAVAAAICLLVDTVDNNFMVR
jgi:hypothetical protein